MGRLAGKVAIVAGAGSSGPGWGNGKATAVQLAREGAVVHAVDRNEDAAAETVRLIEEEGGKAHVVSADVTNADACQGIVDRAVADSGTVDILVNNVGIVRAGGVVELDRADWDAVLAVNLTSFYLLSKAAVPAMLADGGGSIVHIGSIAGLRHLGIPYVSYAATKAGVLGLSRDIALEYAARGVRSNVVMPGLMDTPMIRPMSGSYGDGGVDEMVDKRNAQCPMGRMGDAWDIARAVLFLASDEASYITGTELIVDGGLTARA